MDLPAPSAGATLAGLTADAQGWLVALVERVPGIESGYGRLLAIDAKCEIRAPLLALDAIPLDPGERPSIASAGDAGFAVVWSKKVANEKHARLRVFGPRVCDPPQAP
jgi:hypothetical protein